MSQKLKGCRPSATVIQELSNTYAEYGSTHKALVHYVPKKLEELSTRLEELTVELNAARQQEAAMQAKESAAAELVPAPTADPVPEGAVTQ